MIDQVTYIQYNKMVDKIENKIKNIILDSNKYLLSFTFNRKCMKYCLFFLNAFNF